MFGRPKDGKVGELWQGSSVYCALYREICKQYFSQEVVEENKQ